MVHEILKHAYKSDMEKKKNLVYTFVSLWSIVPWRWAEFLYVSAGSCLDERHNTGRTTHVSWGLATAVHNIHSRATPQQQPHQLVNEACTIAINIPKVTRKISKPFFTQIYKILSDKATVN